MRVVVKGRRQGDPAVDPYLRLRQILTGEAHQPDEASGQLCAVGGRGTEVDALGQIFCADLSTARPKSAAQLELVRYIRASQRLRALSRNENTLLSMIGSRHESRGCRGTETGIIRYRRGADVDPSRFAARPLVKTGGCICSRWRGEHHKRAIGSEVQYPGCTAKRKQICGDNTGRWQWIQSLGALVERPADRCRYRRRVGGWIGHQVRQILLSLFDRSDEAVDVRRALILSDDQALIHGAFDIAPQDPAALVAADRIDALGIGGGL